MNRTKAAMKGGSIIAVIMFLTAILSFWRTKLIIQVYGVEINSVSHIASQIFTYMILFESGIGAAYLYNMYQPFAEKNQDKVSALYNGLNNSLKKIAIKMIIAIIVIAFIYPLFMANNSLTYLKIVLIIILMGLRAVYPYYFTLAKKNILFAQEKQYKTVLIDGLINSITLIFEIYIFTFFQLDIAVVLAIDLIFCFLSNYIYSAILSKDYHYLINNKIEPSYEAKNMTKDILVHQICTLANTHIDTIILSFVNLFSVTVYSAYNSIMSYPDSLISQLVSNLRASLGLKMASKDKNTYEVFSQIMSLNLYISGIVTLTFLTMVNKFIELWLGSEFLLDNLTVILFALILFRRLISNTIIIARDGKGLYKESKNYTLITSISNLLISLLLVRLLGIKGVLLGTIITSYFIMDIGNYYLVYCKIFEKKLIIYFKLLVVAIGIVCSYIISIFIFNFLVFFIEVTWINFIVQTLISVLVSLIIIFILLWIFDKSFIRVIKRIKKTILSNK